MTDKIQKWLIWFALLTSAPIAWGVIVTTVNYGESVLWLVENVDWLKSVVAAHQFDTQPQGYK